MRLRTTLAAVALLVGAQGPAAAEEVAYHDVLMSALDLRDQALRSVGRSAPESDALRSALVATNPEAIAALTPHLPPATELQERLTRAQATLARSITAPAPLPNIAGKAIDFPEPDPISDCIDASPSATHALLEAWSASTEVLAAAKWACLQTELGENASEACTALAVETELLEGDLDRQSFCLGAQRDATLAAFSQTQSNVVDFLNERADATATSRASQASIDALRTTLDSLLLRLAELRTTLVEDDHAIVQGMGDILDDAMGLAAQLTALSADVSDVRFRVQAVQVDVEDAQRRLADVQAEATRIADDSERLHETLLSVHATLTEASTTLQDAADDQRDRRLAAALGDADAVILRYRLPAANGGELERSREVLIRALTAYQALGANTSTSQALLVSGDAAYNQDRPLDAYDAFARSYRALLDTQTTLAVLIMRDSFE